MVYPVLPVSNNRQKAKPTQVQTAKHLKFGGNTSGNHQSGAGDQLTLSPATSHSKSKTPSLLPMLKFGRWRKRTAEERALQGNLKDPNWSYPNKWIEFITGVAANAGYDNPAEFLVAVPYGQRFLSWLNKREEKRIEKPVTAVVEGKHRGKPVKTKVTSLLGGEQIFTKWNKYIDSAQDYIQVALYDFDNIEVDAQGGDHPGRASDSAETVAHWPLQQAVLTKLLEKARKGIPVQLILDSSYEEKTNEFGHDKKRTINNKDMVAHLRSIAQEENLPIKVVHYPRELAKIFHVKLLIVDGKKAIVGGMNLSNHSAANWDACVSLEGAEVANLQAETFHQDWVVGRYLEKRVQDNGWESTLDHLRYRIRPHMYKKYIDELPKTRPVSHPAIRVMNTVPSEYSFFRIKEGQYFQPREEIGDFMKTMVNHKNLKEVLAEQFIFTHKQLTRDLIRRYKNNEIEMRMLHSHGVIKQFPYCRRAVHHFVDAGGTDLLRNYNELQEISQQLHTKTMAFRVADAKAPNNRRKDLWGLLIGSSNLSKTALETNVSEGQRPDYDNLDEVYERGNRDVAIYIQSNRLVKPFVNQFNIDWDYSPAERPTGLVPDDIQEQITFGPLSDYPDADRLDRIAEEAARGI